MDEISKWAPFQTTGENEMAIASYARTLCFHGAGD